MKNTPTRSPKGILREILRRIPRRCHGRQRKAEDSSVAASARICATNAPATVGARRAPLPPPPPLLVLETLSAVARADEARATGAAAAAAAAALPSSSKAKRPDCGERDRKT